MMFSRSRAMFFSLSGDVLSLWGDVLSLWGDVLLLSGDVLSFSGDVLSFSGDVLLLWGDVLSLSGNDIDKIKLHISNYPPVKRAVLVSPYKGTLPTMPLKGLRN
ncbi:hypothetical protein [Oceanobacillus picturae]|uniref:hypothetical protein n=1 Tax=Oceanobacillus picturae TaxID=171693 RepID=UPI00055F1395|nr:hypothetical protein [Oceanobacillus picturae]